MQSTVPLALKVSPRVRERLRCPACSSPLDVDADHLRCVERTCAARYPVVEGVPVLVDDRKTLSSSAAIVARGCRESVFDTTRAGRIVSSLLPSIGTNVRAKQNFRKLGELLRQGSASPCVLVIGGRILGKGMDALALDSSIELVETDVVLGPRTALVCDTQCLPFEDGTFDGVVAQSVFEVLPDPCRAADEVHRVLGDRGLLYVETPFMQQCLGPADFQRFTHAGLRRLFRRFEEIASGAVCGPGMALAWSYHYFLLGFARSRVPRALLQAFATLTSFYLKYVDYLVIDTPGALDAASGCYFLGRKSETIVSDAEIVASYRGAKG